MDFNRVTVVPSGRMEKVEELRFKKGIYDIDLRPVGMIGGLVVDGQEIPHTFVWSHARASCSNLIRSC